MAENFRITIQRTRDLPRMVGKDWAVVGKKEDGTAEYGYTPAIEKIISTCEVIYEQTVDTLDLVGVIATINSISRDGE